MRVLFLLFIAFCCHPGLAQEGSNPKEFVDAYNERFLDRPPLLGSKLEDVVAWDAAGKKFDLAATRGKHTVIVFGCLT